MRGRGHAPVNIALCKYWGKRDKELNLPVTSSLSMSMTGLGATTEIRPCAGTHDRITLNGQEVDPSQAFASRLSAYLHLFRPTGISFEVDTTSDVPVGAGLASSAAGFAAIVLALNDLFGWELDPPSLSILARLGSGSACRSIHSGFVEWQAGERADGMDSYATPLSEEWPELMIGWLPLSTDEKPISSREAMLRTVETSRLYTAWPEQVANDLAIIKQAITDHSLEALGPAVESNALAMHATMWAAWPPVNYWLPETLAVLQQVWKLRAEGLALYFTMDAGPNVKLIYQKQDQPTIRQAFPEIHI